MSIERKTGISTEEIEEDLVDDESDFFYPEENWGEGCCEDVLDDEDDEPIEREYCD